MFSSTPKIICNSNKKTLNRESSNSSSSSSTAISPHHNHSHQITRPRTMEEVWKDINLSSLNDHPPSDNTTNQNPNCIFQDFFNRPFNSKDPIVTAGLTAVLSNSNVPDKTTASAVYGSTILPQPATVLSLNSVPGFGFLETSDQLLVRPTSQVLRSQIQNSSTNVSSLSGPFDALVCSTHHHRLDPFGMKRTHDDDNSSSDRRNKRMIKNRESAARSRARKQAYTNELELEVAQLMEENAELKKQQEQLRLAVAASQMGKKKNTLHRTSTAPF